MHQRTITDFQRKVYRTVSRVPKGSVTTYGAVAKAIGCGSCRAVGQALKKNPFAPDVPCHRVIASDLTLGGFQGASSGHALRRKIKLLNSEGVVFCNGHLFEAGRVFRF